MIALGRKNWMFAGSDAGGEHWAIIASLVGTCRLNDVNPHTYLTDVLERINDHPNPEARRAPPLELDLQRTPTRRLTAVLTGRLPRTYSGVMMFGGP